MIEKYLNKKLINNNLFIIYSNEIIDNIKQIENTIIKRINEIKQIFNVKRMNKIQINIFDVHENYLNYLKENGYNPTIYSKANFNEKEINIYYNIKEINNNFINKIMHEYIHIIYMTFWKDNFDRVIWLDEGISKYFSKELECLNDDKIFKIWYLSNIINRNKEIPNINYLEKHGSNYGEFLDLNTNKYNGYNISYLIVRYLIETKDNYIEIFTQETKIKEIKDTIIDNTINYFNSKLEVNKIKNNYEDIKTINELMDYMNINILYGWLGIDGKVRVDSLKEFKEYYKTMSIKDILKYKVGTCPDQVNLVKNFLDTKKIENQIYVLTGYEIINGIAKERVHFIITYKENNEWYQFEQASRFFRGIFKYGKKENIKQNILDKYKNILKDSNLFEIKEIPTGISYEKLREYIIKEMN